MISAVASARNTGLEPVPDLAAEPPFSPGDPGAASTGAPATGLTPQIASFTAAICSTSPWNRCHAATSRVTLSSSGPGRTRTFTVLPPAHRVRLYCGP